MDEEQVVQTETKSKKRKAAVAPNMLIAAVVAILALGVAGYFAYQNQQLKKNPQKIVQADQDKLISKVGKLMTLPSDEQPSIATVSDKEKLKDQAFFKSAENGDTLLIYTNAHKAILYREKANKIVEVAPIAIDTSATGGTTASSTPTPTPNQ